MNDKPMQSQPPKSDEQISWPGSTITRGTGNVFADLGLDHPEELKKLADDIIKNHPGMNNVKMFLDGVHRINKGDYHTESLCDIHDRITKAHGAPRDEED